jgi:hypothetical protein
MVATHATSQKMEEKNSGLEFKEFVEIMLPTWRNLSQSAEGCLPLWPHLKTEKTP